MIGRLCGLVVGLSLVLLACIVWRPALLHLAWDLGGSQAYRMALSGLLAACGGIVAISAILPAPRARGLEAPSEAKPAPFPTAFTAPIARAAPRRAPAAQRSSLHANAGLIAASVAAAEMAASGELRLKSVAAAPTDTTLH